MREDGPARMDTYSRTACALLLYRVYDMRRWLRVLRDMYACAVACVDACAGAVRMHDACTDACTEACTDAARSARCTHVSR